MSDGVLHCMSVTKIICVRTTRILYHFNIFNDILFVDNVAMICEFITDFTIQKIG